MTQVINTNILSLSAQRNLNSSQSALQTSIQRLSSGLRINSAKDDAAGLAISERFSTQIRGLNQAVRNANDGISLAQTGEGALAEITSNLQRVRELAVQSVNATNSDSDREALDLEVQQRLAEIDRIADQTSFNGRKILDGSFGSAAFQVGANVGETITTSLSTSVRQSAVGAVSTTTSVDLDTLISEAVTGVTGSAASATFDLSGLLGTDFSTATSTATAVADADLPDGLTADTAAVSSGNVDLTTLTTTASGDFDFDGTGGQNATFDVTFGATTANIVLDADYGNADPTTAINAVVAAIQTDIDATFDGVAEGGATFTVGTDANNQITITADAVGANGAITVNNFDGNGEAASILGTITAADGTDNQTFSFDVAVDGGAAQTVTVSGNDNAGVGYADRAAVLAAVNNDLTGATASLVGGAGADANYVQIASDTSGAAGSITVSNESYTGVTDFFGAGATLTDTGADAAAIQLVFGDPGDGNVTVTVDADLSAGNAEAQTNALAAEITGALAGTPQFSVTDDNNGGITLTDLAVSSAFSAGDFTLTDTNDALGGGAGSTVAATSSTSGVATVAAVDANSVTVGAGSLQFAIGDADAVSVAAAEYSTVSSFVSAINTAIGGNATVSLSDANVLTITSGEDVVVTQTSGLTDGTSEVDVFTAASVGSGGTEAGNNITVAAAGSLETANVLTVDASNETIQRIDAALTSVSELRSTFGAIQNRFESTITNLSTTVENLEASRSAIRDADFAAETAALTRAQILQQAGIAALSQANTQPQNVLALLQ